MSKVRKSCKPFAQLTKRAQRNYVKSIIPNKNVTLKESNLQQHDSMFDFTEAILTDVNNIEEESVIINNIPIDLKFLETKNSGRKLIDHELYDVMDETSCGNCEPNESEEPYSDETYNIYNDSDNEFKLDDHLHDNITEDCPLYDSAPLTLRESMLIILTLFVKHNLTLTCVDDIIRAINLHCRKEKLQKNSVHKFKKYFNLTEEKYKKHYYCSNCAEELANDKSRCTFCNEIETNVSYFLELNICGQLHEMYRRKNFHCQLQSRFQRQSTPNVISDVYDGELYKHMEALGFLSNSNNISFTWYTDGIPVYKSSQVSMWPLYFTINELPYKMRTKRENIILAGIWFGKKKPVANNFLQKFQNQLKTLYDGIQIYLSNGTSILVKGILLFGTCDLGAKWQFLNLTQFNGFYGCCNCLNPGETYKYSVNSTAHVYRYQKNFQLRTSKETIQQGLIAINSKTSVMGVKGPSSLSKIMPYFIEGTGIDRMHGGEGGVTKKLLHLWFDQQYQDKPFSLYTCKDIVNELLKKIKPPKFIHRQIRTIDDLAHLKSSELKFLQFYLLIPILSKILRSDFFNNYLIYVIAISILSNDCIPHNMIEVAHELLHKFVCDFEILYGAEHCSINIHQLIHLANCVKMIGPLWAYICYAFEDLNGQFLKSIHGTWHIDSQIVRSHYQFLMMSRKLDNLSEGEVSEFCTSKNYGVKLIEKIFDQCYSVGSYNKQFHKLSTLIIEAIIKDQISMKDIQIYSRLLKDSKLYVSESYQTHLQTESSYVHYYEEDKTFFGRVYCFIKSNHKKSCYSQNKQCQCHGFSHYAIIYKYKGERSFFTNTSKMVISLLHIWKCVATNEIIIIPIDKLISICVNIPVENDIYLGLPVNSKELE